MAGFSDFSKRFDAPSIERADIEGARINRAPVPLDVTGSTSVDQASQDLDAVLFPPIRTTRSTEGATDGAREIRMADSGPKEPDTHVADEHAPDEQAPIPVSDQAPKILKPDTGELTGTQSGGRDKPAEPTPLREAVVKQSPDDADHEATSLEPVDGTGEPDDTETSDRSVSDRNGADSEGTDEAAHKPEPTVDGHDDATPISETDTPIAAEVRGEHSDGPETEDSAEPDEETGESSETDIEQLESLEELIRAKTKAIEKLRQVRANDTYWDGVLKRKGMLDVIGADSGEADSDSEAEEREQQGKTVDETGEPSPADDGHDESLRDAEKDTPIDDEVREESSDGPEHEKSDESKDETSGADETDGPVTAKAIYDAFVKVIEEPDPDKAKEMMDDFWANVLTRGVLEAIEEDGEDAVPGPSDFSGLRYEAEKAEVNPGRGDRVQDANGASEESDLSPIEAEREYHKLEIKYLEMVKIRELEKYPPDSIAARDLNRQMVAILEEQIRMDSIINPTHKDTNDDFLKQEAAARAEERAQESGDPDDRYMRFTPRQLEHLRAVAEDELTKLKLDKRAPGSATRLDDLLLNIRQIDHTLNMWRDVLTSKNPAQRAMILGKAALMRAIEQRVNNTTTSLDSSTESALRDIEFELRGIPDSSNRELASNTLQHIAERHSNRSGPRFVDGQPRKRLGTGSAIIDRADARRLLRRVKRDGLEADLQNIETRRPELVEQRRRTVKEALQKADSELAIAPRIRGRGNASPDSIKHARQFGKSQKSSDKRPSGKSEGGPRPKTKRQEHRAAVKRLNAAQAEVRQARAARNQQNIFSLIMANVAIIGTAVVPKTVSAQARLQSAIAHRDLAAMEAYPDHPIVGRFV